MLGLTFLFLLIGLNMFGVFEIGVGLTRAGGLAQDQEGPDGQLLQRPADHGRGRAVRGPLPGTP